MHILFITTYFEPDSGAAAVRLSRLAKLLHQRGHTVTVLTAMPHYPQGRIAEGYRRKLFMVEEREGLRIIRTWLWATSSPKISRRLISQLSLMLTLALRGMFVKRPDVVFIEGQPVFTALAGWFISKIKRRPSVVNVSDLWPEHLVSVGTLNEQHLVYRIARSLVDMIYRGSRAIVAMSPVWRDRIVTHIGAEHVIRIIYNGVDLNRFRPDLDTRLFKETYNLNRDRWITFIGTFATQYDFESMLDVVAYFQEREDVGFVFIGTGSQRDVVQERLRQSDSSAIRHLDWIPHHDIAFAWAASFITFWAMRDESLYHGTIPAKLYEALASGVPIAAAGTGAGADIITESSSGLVVEAGDTEGLTAVIQHLLDDEAFHQQCSQNGRAYAEAHFDPEAVASAYENVLQGATQHG